MRFNIQHETTYRYSRTVFLDPHTIRLQPRSDGGQRLTDFRIAIAPQPTGTTTILDANGNATYQAWFDGVHDSLVVRVESEVETFRDNPFDFLVSESNQRLGEIYTATERAGLGACLANSAVQSCQGVHALANGIRSEAHCELLPFLMRLCHRLNEDISIVRRENGPALSSGETLANGQGACRDLAVVFVEVCRSVGLAARFVCGYQEGDSDQDRRDLHAWAEVYIPAAGWRGFDPTLGLAVTDRHVVVAASPEPYESAPIEGSFRGTGACATIKANIDLEVIRSRIETLHC